MAKRKNPAAVELGSRGGKARKKKLTPEQRTEIARKAAQSRWQSPEGPSELGEPDDLASGWRRVFRALLMPDPAYAYNQKLGVYQPWVGISVKVCYGRTAISGDNYDLRNDEYLEIVRQARGPSGRYLRRRIQWNGINRIEAFVCQPMPSILIEAQRKAQAAEEKRAAKKGGK